jgi:hypothetical protein
MRAFLGLVLVTSTAFADPSPRISAWKQIELNDAFMRTLTKSQCMTKTIASLGECSSRECVKTLAGILGDCATWSSGALRTFCASYDLEYLQSYCSTNELDAQSCMLLKLSKDTLCRTPTQPLK